MLTIRNKSSAGFTLVELLVAMTLGIILSGGVAVLFLQSGTNFSQDDESARMQENARFALQLLSRELSMAGFYGRYVNVDEIVSTTITDIDECGNDWAVNLDEHIEHDNDVAASPYACIDDADIMNGTDILAIKRVGDVASMEDGAALAPATISATAVYLRSENQGNNLSLVKGDDIAAAAGVDAWQFMPTIYYLRNHSVGGGVADGIPALCRVILINADDMGSDPGGCLVEGIENLQIEYGYDDNNDGSPDRYTSTPADTGDAVSARIYILVRSVNTVRNYTNDKIYNLGETSVAAANDRFMRKVYSTTVSLRNPYNL